MYLSNGNKSGQAKYSWSAGPQIPLISTLLMDHMDRKRVKWWAESSAKLRAGAICFLLILVLPQVKPKIIISPRWVPCTEHFSSVHFRSSVMSDSLWPLALQHARPPCLSPTQGVYSNACPLSRWWHQTISSSIIPFCSCLQSFPASGSFQMIQFFTSSGQSTGVSASTSVLPMNTQDWSPLGRTGWISLQSKGLSRVFSNTTVQKHQFFGAQLSSQSNSHIHTWLLEKT